MSTQYSTDSDKIKMIEKETLLKKQIRKSIKRIFLSVKSQLEIYN
jgi:hypothetical protein